MARCEDGQHFGEEQRTTSASAHHIAQFEVLQSASHDLLG